MYTVMKPGRQTWDGSIDTYVYIHKDDFSLENRLNLLITENPLS